MKQKEKVLKSEIKTYSAEFKVNNKQALLEFLLMKMNDKSRNTVKNLLKNHHVLVDGVVTTQFDQLLVPKQLVQISKQSMRKGRNSGLKTPFDILYEDEDFIAINKPSGLLSIATEREKEKTAYHFLMNYVRKENPKNQIFILHRLDRDTSGIMLFAKNLQVRDLLQKKWNELVSKRIYFAVVNGTLVSKEGTLKNYLAETSTHVVFVSKGKQGREAITHYRVLKEKGPYSLLELSLASGRKNQIRVQLQHLGHPVVGDEKYGAGQSPFKRLGLHASVLELTHPLNRKKLRFEVPLPLEFKKLFK
ncbi:MAG: RluA family pseudouridine synthase [Bacilli bacterium]|jgi:23S rRNA pseudouridine1911/1915/1917 synthase